MALNPFLVDCDTGRDDALALWLCCILDLPLKAVICSYGNTPLSNAAANSANVLNTAGKNNIPVWAGADQPSQHHIAYDTIVVPRHVAGGNGICNVELPRSPVLPEPLTPAKMADKIRVLAEQDGRLDYIVLGPATNLAAICKELGNDFKNCFANIYMGGGKFEWMWTRVPGADFNVVADPYAVDFLLKNGAEIHFVPMDVLFPVYSSLEEIKALEPQTDIARYARDIMRAHALHFSPQPVFRHIDPATILSCLNPDGFVVENIVVNLDQKSSDFARLEMGADGNKAFVYQADEKRFHLFKEKILKTLGF